MPRTLVIVPGHGVCTAGRTSPEHAALDESWVGIHPGDTPVRQTRELLNLPGQIVPVAAIALGIPGELLPARTRYNQAYVHSEKW